MLWTHAVDVLVPGSSGLSLNLDQGHCVVFLGETLKSHRCFSHQDLEIGTGGFNAGVTVRLKNPMHDPFVWYGINYTGTQITQCDFQNKGTLTSPARLFFVLNVPLRYLRRSIIYSVLCDRIVQRVH